MNFEYLVFAYNTFWFTYVFLFIVGIFQPRTCPYVSERLQRARQTHNSTRTPYTTSVLRKSNQKDIMTEFDLSKTQPHVIKEITLYRRIK